MGIRYSQPFHTINSTEPSFNVTLSTLSTTHELYSSTLRTPQGPTGLSMRISESSGVDFRMALGSSDIVATSTGSMLMLGGAVEVINIPPHFSHVAILTTSTKVSFANLTVGYGK